VSPSKFYRPLMIDVVAAVNDPATQRAVPTLPPPQRPNPPGRYLGDASSAPLGRLPRHVLAPALTTLTVPLTLTSTIPRKVPSGEHPVPNVRRS
jgi:hypothetical protein